jgi:pimeloyl-ACP methyl ester carboxylesterase
VLLVHGLGQNGLLDWWHTMGALAGDHHVVALDLPGFGRSTGARGQLTPARYARLLSWLIRELELGEVRLVGHSMGGAVALYHAGTYPEQVSQLVLVNAAGVLQRAAFLREQTTATGSASVDGLPGQIADQARRLFNWGGAFVERVGMMPDLIDLLRASDSAWGVLLGDRPNANAALGLIDTDFSHIVHGLAVPTTIIWGDRDTVSPMRTADMLHGRLARVDLRLIEGAAHVPMHSHRETFIDALRTALANPATAARPAPVWREDGPDFRCENQRGQRLSGHYRRIEIHNCEIHLHDLVATEIHINNAQVRLTHVRLRSPETALLVRNSSLVATNLDARGEPVVRGANARIDIAGGHLQANGEALRIDEQSSVILSTSRIDSGVYRGYLHGAVRAAATRLDDARELGANAR